MSSAKKKSIREARLEKIEAILEAHEKSMWLLIFCVLYLTYFILIYFFLFYLAFKKMFKFILPLTAYFRTLSVHNLNLFLLFMHP
jgi:hypothetical protein